MKHQTIGKQVPTPKRKRTAARVAGLKEHALNASATKSGPGRYHKTGDGSQQQRKRIRAADALMEAWASKRIVKWLGPRDDHGAMCLIGKPYELDGVHPTSREVVLEGWVEGKRFGYTVQRKWLAGISAQRGY